MEDKIDFVMIDKVEGTKEDMVGTPRMYGLEFIYLFIYCRERG